MNNVYIIAGCNGAGKTTASFTILPEILNCREFVNADEIAKGLSPFQPESVSFQAGRIMIKRIDELIDAEVDFGFETTLTTLSYLNTIKLAKEKGYFVTLLFFWLNDVNLAIERVKNRVKEGGHNIPVDVIYQTIEGLHQALRQSVHREAEPGHYLASLSHRFWRNHPVHRTGRGDRRPGLPPNRPSAPARTARSAGPRRSG